jgi:glycosyltransferase domain-containing protein
MPKGLGPSGRVASTSTVSGEESVDRKLTVLLLLKDQAPYTFRWLTYASLIRFPFKVLIADGGADDQVADALSDPSRFPGVDFEYVRYPHDRTLTDFYKKKVDALERITTPYVVKTCNDDFYSVEGLRRSIRFLDANPDYSCGRGEIFNFSVLGRERGGETQNLYGLVGDFHQYKPSPSNEEATAIKRLESLCANYVTTWHDINRTENLARAHRRLLELNPTDLRLCDHVTDSLAVAAGKIYRGLYPYMLHQSNPHEGSGASLDRQFPTYREWTKAPWWHQETSRFFAMVAEEIAKHDRTPVLECRDLFHKSYVDVYLSDRFADDVRVEPSRGPAAGGIGRAIRNAITHDFPRRAYRSVQRQYRRWHAHRAIAAADWSEAVKPVAKFLRVPARGISANGRPAASRAAQARA